MADNIVTKSDNGLSDSAPKPDYSDFLLQLQKQLFQSKAIVSSASVLIETHDDFAASDVLCNVVSLFQVLEEKLDAVSDALDESESVYQLKTEV